MEKGVCGEHKFKELDEKIASFYKHEKRSVPKHAEVRAALEGEAARADTPLPKLVAVLTDVRDSGNKAYIPLLLQIKTEHAKRTVKALYPENYRYVRVIDYEQKVCDIIDETVKSLGTSTRESK